ncbi:hypothetical protein HS088_TW13G00088 [Tripterygium wilfordii]|uniref:Uncharacterized protein n=1 Tax=Tripterygium wilfordii TaxID=458696 RepID=A0A7J7CT00_TRIWF|nr:hypothetical protein HS088_TW13G00088 [Tripterygium wilfordii]
MSSGGPTNSSNNSPRNPTAGLTATRRRLDAVDRASNFSEDEEDNVNGSSAGPHHHCHNHHHNHHHPVIKYLLLRRKWLLFMPEAWLFGIEEGCRWTVSMAQSLRSGRNVGRKIFAALMLMAVVSVFVKFSLLSGHVEVHGKRSDNGLLILQTFKEDWALAQRVMDEKMAFRPKHVLEKLPVSGKKTALFFP